MTPTTYIDSIINCAKLKLHHAEKDTVQPDPYTNQHAYSVHTYIALNPSNGLVKIGRSTNYEHRLQAISNAIKSELSILNVIDGDVEKLLHEKYKIYSVKREWFNMPQSVIEELKQIINLKG